MSRASTLSESSFPGADHEMFRDACARFATGVAIATVCDSAGSPHGLTVSSFTSVSFRPPLILICIDYACYALEHFRSSPHFAINILGEEQQNLSVRFSELPEARFEGVDWYPGATGAPLLPKILAVLECQQTQVVEAGDHAIVVGEAVRTQTWEGRPLLYFDRNYRAMM